MQKVITSRFASKCKSCGGGIAAGERVYWHGSKKGVSHIDCVKPPKLDKPIVDTRDGTKKLFHTFAELREIWNRYRTDRPAYRDTLNKNSARLDFIEGEWGGSWSGSTAKEMSDFLNNGFKVEGLEGVEPTLIAGKPRRKLKFAEEGDELLVDLAWSGVDEHFLEWEKRDRKPGLKVLVYQSFSAGVDQKLIKQFQLWVARMFQTLDESAIDVQVEIVCKWQGLAEQDDAELTDYHIRVKEFGEASDMAAWSAMFAPGSYRVFQFFGAMEALERQGEKITKYWGYPKGFPQWDLKYDPDENIMTVESVNGNVEFPEFDMTQKLSAVLKEIAG